MINSLLDLMFGCSHKRTSFPFTPSQKSKPAQAGRAGTYIVCLDCGQEFAYNWKEMRVGNPVPEIPVTLSALQAERTVTQ